MVFSFAGCRCVSFLILKFEVNNNFKVYLLVLSIKKLIKVQMDYQSLVMETSKKLPF